MKRFLFLAAWLLAPVLPAAQTPLLVDKQLSRIGYAVAAPFGNAFDGTLTAYDLDLAADPSAAGGIARAEIRFRFTDLRSGHARRDQDMRDWQNTEQFPECIFTLTALEPASAAGQYTARGQFIFHGVTRELVFPVTIAEAGQGRRTIDGEARIDTRDFQLPPIRRFFLFEVDPVVVVKLHIIAAPPPR